MQGLYLPDVVKQHLRLLRKLSTKNPATEQGFSIYFRSSEYYVQQDNGLPALTVSDFSQLSPEKLLFVLKPDHIYLLHSHPFSEHPSPSGLDISTAQRFREYYRDSEVTCVVVSKKGYYFY